MRCTATLRMTDVGWDERTGWLRGERGVLEVFEEEESADEEGDEEEAEPVEVFVDVGFDGGAAPGEEAGDEEEAGGA